MYSLRYISIHHMCIFGRLIGLQYGVVKHRTSICSILQQASSCNKPKELNIIVIIYLYIVVIPQQMKVLAKSECYMVCVQIQFYSLCIFIGPGFNFTISGP